LLGSRSNGLCLLRAFLHFLGGDIGVLVRVQQLPKLGLQLICLLALLLQLLLLRDQGIAKLLNLFGCYTRLGGGFPYCAFRARARLSRGAANNQHECTEAEESFHCLSLSPLNSVYLLKVRFRISGAQTVTAIN